jgi:hypothetical protein
MTDYFSAILGAVTKIFIRTSKDYQLKEFENLCLTIVPVSLFGESVVLLEIIQRKNPGKNDDFRQARAGPSRFRAVAVSSMTHEVIFGD